MKNQSNLKTQYPLSPRKFTKKMIEKSSVFLFLGIFLGVMSWFLIKTINIANLASNVYLISFAIGILFFAIPTIIYGIYVHFYIKTYYYEDNDHFLTIRKGPITPAEINVQYMKMQDVYVDQDILDRILGIYDVHISSATYTSGIEAHIDGVDKNNADSLKNLFLNKIKKGTSDSVNSNINLNMNTNSGRTETIQKVNFSKPISSDEYGLGDNWWIGEFVKIAIASCIYPILITFWLSSIGAEDRGNIYDWNKLFLMWISIFVIYIMYKIIYLYLWKKHYKYEFGQDYIYMKIGVLSVSEKNMGYNTIQDVRVQQGIVDRIFGVADLIIENASGSNSPVNPKDKNAVFNGIIIEGLSLSDAKHVSEELKSVIINKKDLSKGL